MTSVSHAVPVELSTHSGPARSRDEGILVKAVGPGGPEQLLTVTAIIELTSIPYLLCAEGPRGQLSRKPETKLEFSSLLAEVPFILPIVVQK